jgi:hypothetical protein
VFKKRKIAEAEQQQRQEDPSIPTPDVAPTATATVNEDPEQSTAWKGEAVDGMVLWACREASRRVLELVKDAEHANNFPERPLEQLTTLAAVDNALNQWLSLVKGDLTVCDAALIDGD